MTLSSPQFRTIKLSTRSLGITWGQNGECSIHWYRFN